MKLDKTKTTLSILYAFLYAGMVTLITIWVSCNPTVRMMESALYDRMQRALAIEEPSNFGRYKQFSSYLDEIQAINIDTSIFEVATGRLRRDRLAILLEKIADGPEQQAIFLDYIIAPPATVWDSILKNRIRSLQKKIVLPFEVSATLDDFSSDNCLMQNLKFTPIKTTDLESIRTGYLYYSFQNNFDQLYRYTKVAPIDQSTPSSIEQILETLPNRDAGHLLSSVPDPFEINFLLKDPNKALRPVQASQILNFNYPLKEHKIIFIGHFEDQIDIYNRRVDQFPTPIDLNMNGINLVLNSYLNVVSGSWLRPPTSGFIFFSNLLLGLAGIFYFERKKSFGNTSLLISFATTTVITLLLFGMLHWLYLEYHLKYPIVVTSVFLILNPAIYGSVNKTFSKLTTK